MAERCTAAKAGTTGVFSDDVSLPVHEQVLLGGERKQEKPTRRTKWQ